VKLAIVGIELQNANLAHAAESIRLLRSSFSDGKVVLVGETDKSLDLQRLLPLSPDACIFTLQSRDTLIKVLELIFMDQHVFVCAKSIATVEQHLDGGEPERISPPYNFYELGDNQSLSPRESQILTSLAQGKSNKLIARVCHISEATVKAHLKAILRKTRAHNRTQAAIWAIQHGFTVLSLDSNGVAVQSNGHAVSTTLPPVRQEVAIPSVQSAASPHGQTTVAPRAR
jgi:two-component system nitrate/nitrite response regulator NarL